MKKKLLVLLLVLVALLAACGAPEEPETQPSTEPARVEIGGTTVKPDVLRLDLTGQTFTLEALLDAPVTLEVNYGAVAKGYTIEQYPSADILSKWLAAGKPVLYSSDCHLAENLLFGYDRYEALIQSCSK